MIRGGLGLVLGVAALVGFEVLVVAHGEGFPMATGRRILPAFLGTWAIWAVAGTLACAGIGLALAALADRVRLPRVPVAVPALVGVLAAAAIGVWLGGVDLTPDDSARQTLATLLREGRTTVYAGTHPALIDGRPAVPLLSALVLVPFFGLGWVPGALSHGVTVLAVHRLARRLGPGWADLAAWVWALCPGALLVAGTSLPQAWVLACFAWALVLWERPWGAVLVAFGLALDPVGALFFALGMALWRPTLAPGVLGGLLLAGVLALVHPIGGLPGGDLDGWRHVASPGLGLLRLQVALGWPFGLALAVFARHRTGWVGLLLVALGSTLVLGVSGPDWVGPVGMHLGLLPAVMVSLAGAWRASGWLDSRVPGALLLAAVLVTATSWGRHRVASASVAASALELPAASGTFSLPQRVGRCGKAPPVAWLGPPVLPGDGIVLGPTGDRVLHWDPKTCRLGVR